MCFVLACVNIHNYVQFGTVILSYCHIGYLHDNACYVGCKIYLLLINFYCLFLLFFDDLGSHTCLWLWWWSCSKLSIAGLILT